MKSHKHISSGFEFGNDIKKYIDIVSPFWESHPAFFTSRYPIILFHPLTLKEKFKSIHALILWIYQSFINIKNFTLTENKADILIYSSTKKPNVHPMLDMLSDKLTRKKIKCISICGESCQQIPNFYEKYRYGFSKLKVMELVMKSFFDTILLYVLFLKNDKEFFKSYFFDFSFIWYQLLLAHHRLNFSRKLLKILNPKLILTNGDHIPFASDLTIEGNKNGVYTVWIYNEHARTGLLPIISNEMLVWNKTIEQMIRNVSQNKTSPKITIIGNAQIDTLKIKNITPIYENSLKKKISNKNICIFLSEYDANNVLNTEIMTSESLFWIAKTAEKCLDWTFIICARPGHEAKELPGFEFIHGKKNIIFPSIYIPFNNLLLWENVKAVTACGSTGLFVAAGVGKAAFRLMISPEFENFAFIDEVSTKISSVNEFIINLRKNSRLKLNDKTIKYSYSYPYKHTVLNRLEYICTKRLSEIDTQYTR